ncbi:MAG TPA: ATPase, T2SS/T4P/T4SS family [Acidimicrobiales bacterium]|nr:ATPase, T2SS/T4P/T4SS family [Acidimicrobiales bacterium]
MSERGSAERQHELVTRLRRQVALLIGDEVDRREREDLAPLDDADRRMMADAEIRRTLTEHWRTCSQRGEAPLSREQEEAVADAVITSVFSALPGLDAYLARDDVTDIFINGCDDVRLRTLDGDEIVVPPLVASDAELITLIQGLARRGGRLGAGDVGTPTEVGGDHEKEFNASSPLLNLRLSDGSRLAAAAWVTSRPYVSIRRHPLADAEQKDLVARGMYGEDIASLLAAAVRARKTILVAGGQGRGKTTLMRALLHECDPAERIMVLEQEPELRLDADPARHNQVLSWIARSANMEGEGAVTLADLALAIKRHNPDRIVVGEVLGAEVMVMLEAAGQGIAGALCTMHAKDAYRVFGRMVHYAQLGLPTIPPGFVLDTAADALDLVVYLDITPGGRRVVSEISHVRGFDPRDRIVVTDEWYIPGPDRAAVRNPMAPPAAKVMDELVAYGYDPTLEPGW